MAPLVDAGPDQSIHLGDSVRINAFTNVSNPTQLIWTPSATLDCDTCINPIAKPFSNQNYIITVADQNGCLVTDSMRILVDTTRRVYIPNIFTPESLNNDIFTVFTGPEAVKIHKFLIFDRWGENVFSLTNIEPGTTFGWDGKFRGRYPNNDVFVYVIEIEFTGGKTEIFKGDVTLHR